MDHKFVLYVIIDEKLPCNSILLSENFKKFIKEDSKIIRYPLSNSSNIINISDIDNISYFNKESEALNNSIIVSTDIAKKLGCDYILDTIILN